MFTNVWDSSAMGTPFFLGNNHRLGDFGFGDDERIGERSPLEKLLSIEILPKVWVRINRGDEGELFRCRVFKKIGILYQQLPDAGIVEFVFKLEPCLTNGNYHLVCERDVEFFPKGRESVMVVMIENI